MNIPFMEVKMYRNNKRIVCLLLSIFISIMCVGCSSGSKEVSESTDPQAKANTDVFHFSANEFAYQLSSKYVVGAYELLGSLDTLDNGDLVCSIISPDDMFGAVSFIGNGGFLTAAQDDDHSITGIMTYIFLDVSDADVTSEILLGIVGVCDPTLNQQSTLTVCSAITDAAQNNEQYEYNGIQYSLIGMDNYLLFSATLNDQNSK